jgi:hypothetical protein
MTLRRLNLKIQGLPESYATEPYMGESMVIGEAHSISVMNAIHPHGDVQLEHIPSAPLPLHSEVLITRTLDILPRRPEQPYGDPVVEVHLDTHDPTSGNSSSSPITATPTLPHTPPAVTSRDAGVGDDLLEPLDDSEPLQQASV